MVSMNDSKQPSKAWRSRAAGQASRPRSGVRTRPTSGVMAVARGWSWRAWSRENLMATGTQMAEWHSRKRGRNDRNGTDSAERRGLSDRGRWMSDCVSSVCAFRERRPHCSENPETVISP
ncbi:TPA: hypothetical protein N0F65_010956 [Lagenidium giganteum]|uniref:Uncharacterized protein n=1 Tax=Lagenidium giganteum TaxID=4803 RepID=A0AAV2Z8Z0_9STRA|nr:TPA: hypothetical protein N0F65_010956 [Lagenidium giganteum]